MSTHSALRPLARLRSRRAALIPGLVVLTGLLAVVGLAAVSIGPVDSSLPRAVDALLRAWTGGAQDGAALLVTGIRLPRVLTSILVGGALAVAGAAMQTVFRNPLAEPGITGVSSGAAVVAVLLLVTGVAATAPWALPLGAFVGALAVSTTVQLAGLGRRSGSAATLLLVGIALNAFCGAIISAVIANAPDGDAARSAVFWLNGDLSGRTMTDVGIAVAPILLGAAVVIAASRQLDMLDLGDELARAAGVEVRRTTHIVLAAAALTTAAAVSITGIISFVGLVVPHLVRFLTGPRHTLLLPASFLVGGVFLTVADTAARMLFTPVVLQTGTITALVGAPFLLVLVLRRRRVSR